MPADMGTSDLGSQTDAVRRPSMGSAPKSTEELLARLEAAVERLEARRPALPLVLTVKAAAEQLSVSERTMRGLLASGEVASAVVGGRRMVPSTELERIARAAPETVAPRKRATRRPERLDVTAELARADTLRAGRRR